MYKYSGDNCLQHKMLHISLKPNMFFKLYHVIAIEKNDIKNIQQKILYDNDWAWKTCVYGNSWDIDIIRMLKRKHPTLQKIIDLNKLKTGAGISYNDGKFDASGYLGRKIIESSAIDSFFYNGGKSSIFSKNKIYRLAKPEVFEPPYCLMRKGPNCKTYRIRAAYTEDDVIFKEAISAIKGNSSQKELLLNITGLLNSSLYAYLNLMLGSSLGIEREQVFMDEIYQYPFEYDSEISKRTEKIQEKSYSLDNVFLQDIEDEIRILDEIIFEKFGLKDDPFIDYALNVQIPLLSSKKMTFDEVKKEELLKYAEVFLKYWKELMGKKNKHIYVSLYPKIMGKFSVFELEISDIKLEKEINIIWDVDNDKEILSRFMIDKINDQFYQIKDVLYFNNNSFYIIKSNESKNWHRAMAYIDNAAVVDSILSDRKGE